MSSTPRFFQQPLQYLRWASIEKPAIFYSIAVGCLGPVFLVVVPPLRRMIGDEQRPQIPLTYPSMLFSTDDSRLEIVANLSALVPSGPRKQLKGYDDE